MAGEYTGRRNFNTQVLDELESLSQSLYQSQPSTTNRRTASLALPRSLAPPIPSIDEIDPPKNEEINPTNTKLRSRRMSMSPWRSRPKLEEETEPKGRANTSNQLELKNFNEKETQAEKKGLWNWKPIRALAHIRMQKLSCLFSVEVVTVQGLPASMNGLRLSVCVRKKETKDGLVQTMPSRVLQGAADFEETLFVKCHVYYTPASSGKQQKFEPRPFWIYVFAVDAEELDFGRSTVDLTQLIQESMEKNLEGTRVRQWDVSFNLLGKAKGGELVLKLGFQIMEKDGGVALYSQQAEEMKYGKPSYARKQSKMSFSASSPRLTGQRETSTPSQRGAMVADLQGIDDLDLDEPAPVLPPSTSVQKSEEPKTEDFDLPDFEVVDKGVEIQKREEEEREEEGESEEKSLEERSNTSEVVKEVVPDQVHLTRLSELDSIAQQIKALESMMGEEKAVKPDEETGSQGLDADEETVAMEFLQLLEGEDGAEEYHELTQPKIHNPPNSSSL